MAEGSAIRVVHYEEANWGARPGLAVAAGDDGVVRDGKGTKPQYIVLQHSAPGAPLAFQMALVRYPEARSYTRHRHKTDQLRYVLSGAEPYRSDSATPAGSLLYITSGTFYGPADRAAGEEILSIEFGGADARCFLAADVGPKGIIPRPRYGSPVELNPEAFNWRAGAPGLEVRELASFTERSTVLTMIGVDGGARGGLCFAHTALGFVTKGLGSIGSEPLGERDSVLLAPDEPAELGARSRLELLFVELPGTPR